jgi:hypothetical protein
VGATHRLRIVHDVQQKAKLHAAGSKRKPR